MNAMRVLSSNILSRLGIMSNVQISWPRLKSTDIWCGIRSSFITRNSSIPHCKSSYHAYSKLALNYCTVLYGT